MTHDTLVTTPGGRWRLYARTNGTFYVLSPMGRTIEADAASSEVFRVCAVGLGVTVAELADLCDRCPPTEPAPAAAPASAP